MATSSPHSLLDYQLRTLYGSELQLLAVIPRLIAKVRHPRLTTALAEHRQNIKAHAVRIESCFSLLGMQARYDLCDDTSELLDEMLAALGDDPSTQQEIDLAVNLQLLAQLELSLYANARILADAIDESLIIQILERSMREELAAEAVWRDIAVDAVHPETFASSSAPAREQQRRPQAEAWARH